VEASRRGLFSRLTRRDTGEDAGDWLTSTAWERADREAFERRLGRARPSERAHCLRRKAAALLESGDPALEEPAAGLLERLLTHHAEDEPEGAAAHGLLARLAERRGDLAVAIEHAEQALAAPGLDGPELAARQLQLASLLAAARAEGRAAEASKLLDDVLTCGVEPGPLQRFAYLAARARLADEAGREDRASAYARAGLRLLTDQQPAPLADLSAARRDAATLSELQRLADAGRADAVVAGMEVPRAPDGSVRWTWGVVRRLDEGAGDRPAYGAWEDAAAPLLRCWRPSSATASRSRTSTRCSTRACPPTRSCSGWRRSCCTGSAASSIRACGRRSSTPCATPGFAAWSCPRC
jgi:tetratricopeptide (TPR) repeat protein